MTHEKVYRLRAEPAAILATPGWAILFGENDSSLHDMYFYVWIVTDGETIGLIDAGLPLDPREADALGATNAAFGDPGGFRSVRTVTQILDDVGISPADVSFVAITQTVTYHSGGIDAELFPNAVFYIARDGVMELLSGAPGHPAPEFYFSTASWASLRELAIQNRLRLVEASEEVRPGVHFEVTGGHHPGSAAVLVDTADGLVGVLETAFFRSNLDTGRPIGIAEDLAAARRAMVSFARRCDVVVAIHDPENAQLFGASQ